MSNLALTKPAVVNTTRKMFIHGKNLLIKQSPIILAGTAMVGVVTTGYLAARGGIRANELITVAENEKINELGEGSKLTFKEKVEVSWRAYAPAVISGGLTIGAIIASSAISQRRQAALAGLYALSETALKEYQDKIEQELGSKKAQGILDDINGDRVKNSGVPPWDDSVLPRGECLCFDKFTGRYFHSSVQKIGVAVSEVNECIYGGDFCVSLNEFYGILDNPELPTCGLGDSIGWNIDGNCKPYFTSTLTSDMRPVLVLDWANGHEPNLRYRDI